VWKGGEGGGLGRRAREPGGGGAEGGERGHELWCGKPSCSVGAGNVFLPSFLPLLIASMCVLLCRVMLRTVLGWPIVRESQYRV